ncbi:MAG: hypothetical protein HOP19_26065 [Acidobacteria bacterium]|nr:hypothetical protein [Acidobacteriota bacterium]
MAEQLTFDVKHIYPDDVDGITLEVILISGTTSTRTKAKLDCGADHCIFSREVGLKLGIDIESGLPKRMSSLTGTLDTFGHEITIQVAGIALHSVVYFAKHAGLPRNLLGRHGCIRQMFVGLVDYDNTLYLSPYSR